MNFEYILRVIFLAIPLSMPLSSIAQTTTASGSEAGNMQSIEQLRVGLRQKKLFALPDGKAADAARRAMEALFYGSRLEEETLADAGLEQHAQPGWKALADIPASPAGRGLFAYRPGGLQILLSAPHQFHDIRTGEIAGLMFEELGMSAVAFNTAPRSLRLSDGRLSDLGKLTATHFNFFHLAFHAAFPEGRVVQLHGFAAEKRESAAARSADIILSNGTERPDAGTKAVAGCLRRAGILARIYPDEVTELGGTTNATLAALISAGSPVGSFLHVEMSRPLRDQLSKDPQLRFVFGTCLSAGS